MTSKTSSKMQPIHIRVKPETEKAIKRSQRELIARDRVPYTFNEVARFYLNAGLFSQGKLPTAPTLDGDGSTQVAKQAYFKQRIRKQLKQAATQ